MQKTDPTKLSGQGPGRQWGPPQGSQVGRALSQPRGMDTDAGSFCPTAAWPPRPDVDSWHWSVLPRTRTFLAGLVSQGTVWKPAGHSRGDSGYPGSGAKLKLHKSRGMENWYQSLHFTNNR